MFDNHILPRDKIVHCISHASDRLAIHIIACDTARSPMRQFLGTSKWGWFKSQGGAIEIRSQKHMQAGYLRYQDLGDSMFQLCIADQEAIMELIAISSYKTKLFIIRDSVQTIQHTCYKWCTALLNRNWNMEGVQMSSLCECHSFSEPPGRLKFRTNTLIQRQDL